MMFLEHRLSRSKRYWATRKIMRVSVLSSLLCSEPGDSRPYANVLVNNVSYRGLLDSGASVSVLGCGSEKYLANSSSSSTFYHFPTHINTASRQPQRVFGYIYALNTFNGVTHSIKLYIVPSLEQSLYLGIDFWNRFSIIPKISSLNVSDDLTN